jgi:predicted dehydrogenase
MANLGIPASGVHIQGSDIVKVGLVGCGGRGRDAVKNCVESSQGVQVWACGDAFSDRVKMARDTFNVYGDKNKVTDDRSFVGLDAYKKVIDSGANYIILATPPGYRPLHLRAAIEAGKHVFAEKPIATCPTGIRSVMETGKIAAQKGLAIVAGTQRRHQFPYIETIKRIHDGALGDILNGQIYWMQGDIWAIPREPAMNDMEALLRNWQYYTALGGDHVVEQHIHNVDVMNWVMHGHPTAAYSVGGRQVRTDANRYGHVWDHFGVEFEYPNGVTITSMSRQQPGTEQYSRVAERFLGTKGFADPSGSIKGVTNYRWDGDKPLPYVQEHADNIAAIRAGKPLNEAQAVAESTMSAIMARMSAYSGQKVTWDQCLNSKLDLRPDNWGMGDAKGMPAVAIPGKSQLEE